MKTANPWSHYVASLQKILYMLSIMDGDGKDLDAAKGFLILTEWARQIREAGRCIFFIGNGASASMASHFSADMAKNGKIRTRVFTDLSLLTATANDICYEEVYSDPLKLYMKPGDMLVAISSSGNSPNIVKGTETAKALEGKVVTLSAMNEDNVIRKRGDLNLYIPGETYGMAETGHAAILHFWMDSIESDMS